MSSRLNTHIAPRGFGRIFRQKDGGGHEEPIPLRGLQKEIKACIDETRKIRVVIASHRKPEALFIGVDGEDWNVVIAETDAAFWKIIQQRRKQAIVSFDELKAKLNHKR